MIQQHKDSCRLLACCPLISENSFYMNIKFGWIKVCNHCGHADRYVFLFIFFKQRSFKFKYPSQLLVFFLSHGYAETLNTRVNDQMAISSLYWLKTAGEKKEKQKNRKAVVNFAEISMKDPLHAFFILPVNSQNQFDGKSREKPHQLMHVAPATWWGVIHGGVWGSRSNKRPVGGGCRGVLLRE